MNRGRSTALLAAALMALFAGLCATTARAVGEQVLVETDHLRVSVPEGFPEKWAGGPFFPIRLRLENRTSRPLQASFFTDDRLFNGVGGSNLSSARTGVQIPPGVSTRDVFLPLAFHHGQSYRQIVLEAEGVNGRVHRPVRHGDLSGTRSYLLVTQDGDKMDAELSTALKGVPW